MLRCITRYEMSSRDKMLWRKNLKQKIFLFIRCIIFGGILLSFMGCSSLKKINPFASDKVDQKQLDFEKREQLDSFQEGENLVGQENYSGAIKAYQTFLKKYPGSEFELMAIFNLGSAYEGYGDCKNAAKYYRRVVRLSGERAKRTQAEALVRLSYAYECMGKDKKVIATLLDAKRRADTLPKEVAQAEVPARLAGAYARIGNHKQAQMFFQEAKTGLKVINNQVRTPTRKIELMAKTFYFMGSMQNIKIGVVTPEAYVESIKTFQPYLVRSAEFAKTNWAQRAADEIQTAYNTIWDWLNTIGRVKYDRPKKQKLAEEVLISINLLKNNRIRDASESILVKNLFAKMDLHEQKIQGFLTGLEIRNDMSEASKQRTKIKRNLKFVPVNPKSKK